MSSRATVRRATGRTVQDEATGREVTVWASVHTVLPFRLRQSRGSVGSSRSVSVGGVDLQLGNAEGHMPADTTDLRDGDLLEVTAGEWSGTVWRIVEAAVGDQQTARRVAIIEAARPKEWT